MRHIFKSEPLHDFGSLGAEQTSSIVELNKPIYLGVPSYDHPTIICRDYFMIHLKTYYGERAKLACTDTDRVFCCFQTTLPSRRWCPTSERVKSYRGARTK